MVGRQGQTMALTLRSKRRAFRGWARNALNIALIGPAAIGMSGQQNAQFFKAFANSGNGLREVQVAL
jgi:hypothetical protein